MTDKSLLKEAEKNVVNHANLFNDLNEVVIALRQVGNKYCREHIARDKFFEGLSLMQSAIREEYAETCLSVMAFAGIGGKKADKFSKDKFKEIFNEKERYIVGHFLNENLSYHRWNYKDAEQLRKEAQEEIKKIKDNE